MMVCVLTSDLTTGDESFRAIDHCCFEQRKWLAKHVIWALHNRKSVKTWNRDAPDAPHVSDFNHLPRDPRRLSQQETQS